MSRRNSRGRNNGASLEAPEKILVDGMGVPSEMAIAFFDFGARLIVTLH
ncbi:MAG TPA: hypothetical protein VEK34_14375 [Methylocella sp.]|nr:hypothetical protein [Methylocella sp.]